MTKKRLKDLEGTWATTEEVAEAMVEETNSALRGFVITMFLLGFAIGLIIRYFG